jgi:CheY-like chemotaxis protein
MALALDRNGTSLGPRAGRSELRVLVVEDDADTASSLAILLTLDGYEARVTGDGRTALRLARAWPPDVVLLDLVLPGGLDGYELARRLTDLPAPKRPLLIAVTGLGQDADRRRSAEAGIDLHLLKPVDPAWLQRLLRRFQAVLYE